MNSFVDLKKISSYATAASEKLCMDFFQEKDQISGEEIKSFSSLEQLNLFILKNLFEKWQDETNRLKSPYFDYEDEEVQKALKNLLNTLSNHIQIKKEFFKPLVNKACEETLLLAASPSNFITQELSIGGVGIDKEKLFRIQKFIRINKPLIEELASFSKTSSTQPTLSIEELKSFLYSKERDATADNKAIEQIADLLKIEIKDIFITPAITSSETNEEIHNKDPAEADAITQQDINLPAAPDEIITPSLNDRFLREEKTLNEILAEKTQSKSEKIQDLRSAIPLNEKFVFIKELFGNDPSAFALAMSRLEKVTDLDSALKTLTEEFSEKYNWDFDHPQLKELIRLVERRFL